MFIQTLKKYIQALKIGRIIDEKYLLDYLQYTEELQNISGCTHIWNLLAVIVPELKLFHGGLDMNIIWWISPVSHLEEAVQLLQLKSSN